MTLRFLCTELCTLEILLLKPYGFIPKIRGFDPLGKKGLYPDHSTLPLLTHALNELSVASMQHGLKINMAKTKVLQNKHVIQRPVVVGGSEI